MHLPTPTPDDRSPETRSTDMPAHPDPTHRDHGGTAPPAQAAGTPASRAGDSLTVGDQVRRDQPVARVTTEES